VTSWWPAERRSSGADSRDRCPGTRWPTSRATSSASTEPSRGTIQGTFTTASGTPIAYADVVAYTGTEDYLGDATTDAKGKYRITGVTAGGVKLNFSDNGREQWSPGKRDSAGATTYSLAAGGSLTVDEKQIALGTIAGHFTDADGAGVPAQISAVGLDYWSFVAGSTGDDGDYSVDVLPGTYHVSYQWGSATQWAPTATTEDDAETITVASGQTTALDVRKLPTGTIGGHLTTTDGSPLAEASVTLRKDDLSVGFATTDETGAYSLGEAFPASD
jgi:hypothetical protein